MAHDQEPPRIPGGGGPKWVKVEFYGLLDAGRSLVDVNPEDLAGFARTLGFSHVGPVTAELTVSPFSTA